MCGENLVGVSLCLFLWGSPPHVRGKRVMWGPDEIMVRITPACAGKTRDSGHSGRRTEDHPRMCGENTSFGVCGGVTSGSPPHVRGKRIHYEKVSVSWGITPACAGKTGMLRCSIKPRRDHPRMCGENLTMNNETKRDVGSPPHVRGKPPLLSDIRTAFRITPACAGKTELISPQASCTRDHPRMCGENAKVPPEILNRTGSPPHVRGKH